MATVRHLAARGTHFYVGLGVGAHLERWQVPPTQIHELDWWEAAELKGLRITCTPARHYSGRRAMDNSTLWSVVGAARRRRRRLLQRRHRLRAALRRDPAPAWSGRPRPDEDRRLRRDLARHPHGSGSGGPRPRRPRAAASLLPMHWATFDLSYHAWDEPILRTLAAAAARRRHGGHAQDRRNRGLGRARSPAPRGMRRRASHDRWCPALPQSKNPSADCNCVARNLNATTDTCAT